MHSNTLLDTLTHLHLEGLVSGRELGAPGQLLQAVQTRQDVGGVAAGGLGGLAGEAHDAAHTCRLGGVAVTGKT
jgi:hypothetical protein